MIRINALDVTYEQWMIFDQKVREQEQENEFFAELLNSTQYKRRAEIALQAYREGRLSDQDRKDIGYDAVKLWLSEVNSENLERYKKYWEWEALDKQVEHLFNRRMNLCWEGGGGYDDSDTCDYTYRKWFEIYGGEKLGTLTMEQLDWIIARAKSILNYPRFHKENTWDIYWKQEMEGK